MIGTDWQRQAKNTTQHDRFYSVVKRPVPRKPRWGASVIRHEDMDDDDRKDDTLDTTHEASHMNIMHFIA